MNDTRATIIIPCFNESAALASLLDRLLALARGQPWSIIVVDDGSTDQTPQILAAYADRVEIIRHHANRGYGAALKSGILAARTRDIVTMDADGQHDPADLPELVRALEDVDCVIGTRNNDQSAPPARRPGKRLLRWFCNFIVQRQIPDINCGFRGGRRRLYLRMLDLLPDGFSFTTTSLIYVLKSGVSCRFYPVRCMERTTGKSSVRIATDGLNTMFLALRLGMLFDPLRVFGYPAVACMLTGLLYQGYILLTYGLHIEGGAILAIICGCLLFFLGMLGDQVASLRKEMSAFHSLLLETRQGPDAP